MKIIKEKKFQKIVTSSNNNSQCKILIKFISNNKNTKMKI